MQPPAFASTITQAAEEYANPVNEKKRAAEELPAEDKKRRRSSSDESSRTLASDQEVSRYGIGEILINLKLETCHSRFILSKEILARSSAWFKREIELAEATQLATSEQEFGQRMVCFSLKTAPEGIPVLIFDPEHDKLEAKFPMDLGFGDNAPASIKPESDVKVRHHPNRKPSDKLIIEAYESLLSCFENIAHKMSATDIQHALLQSELLIDIAKTYVCVGLVAPHIINMLSEYRQQLLVAISRDPARWLMLSMHLRSGLVFSEALIHLIGAHPAWPGPTPKKVVPAELRKLIQERSNKITTRTVQAEKDLLINTIVAPTEVNGFDEDLPVTIETDVGTWHILQIYRDYLVSEILKLGRMSLSERALHRGTFFRKIGRGGDEYLPLEEVQAPLHNLEGKALSATDDAANDLKMLKAFSKILVKDLVRNTLMLDVERSNIGYLTCVEVRPDDYPWNGPKLDAE